MNKYKFSLILVLGSLLAFSSQASSPLCSELYQGAAVHPFYSAENNRGQHVFRQVDRIKNSSKLMRSNAGHFWTWAKKDENIAPLLPWLKTTGVVMGDPHLGNFSVVPAELKSGTRRLKFLNIDFDDSGRGPFILDFVRFVTVAKATQKKVKFKHLLESYLEGLEGREMEVPSDIQKALDFGISEYDKKRANYVEKRIHEDKFEFREGEIEPWKGRPNLEDFKKSFPDIEFLDIAKRPKEKGGSAQALRLWALIKDEKGARRIFELKGYLPTSLARYSNQLSPAERIKETTSVFWKGISPDSYKLITVNEDIFYWREKKVNLLKYEDAKSEIEGLLYIAYQLGLSHGSQPYGSQYAKKIDSDYADVKEAVKEVVKSYLEIADDQLD